MKISESLIEAIAEGFMLAVRLLWAVIVCVALEFMAREFGFDIDRPPTVSDIGCAVITLTILLDRSGK